MGVADPWTEDGGLAVGTAREGFRHGNVILSG
jgi:hypothetical protein